MAIPSFVRYALVSIALLISPVCSEMSHGEDPKEKESPIEAIALLHSLYSEVETSWTWTGKKVGSDVAYPSYDKRCMMLKELAARIGTNTTRSVLFHDARINAVEKHLIDIAIAIKEKPETFRELDIYYEKSWPRGPIRPHVPVSPRADEKHMIAEYREAWEFVLLFPTSSGLMQVQRTACRALAQIGDPKSLELLEAVYRWVLDVGAPVTYAHWIPDALGRYEKSDALPEALQAAWRCWAYTKAAAGKPGKYTTVPENTQESFLENVAKAFSPEFLGNELKKAEPGSGYESFLQAVAALQ